MPEEQAKDISVRVAIRSRPLISKEVAEGCQLCVSFTPGEPQVILGKNKAFTFDYALRAEDPQEMVYQKVVARLVDGLFKGYNATVLAYGQTGSGKTYAMGNAYNMTDELKMGVIPRVIQNIFQLIEEKQDMEIVLKVSYLEIYNEDIHDLLSKDKKETLAIREDIDGGIRVAGLSEVTVTSAGDMFRCLENGSVGRTTGSTAMNLQSSRSHAIFTIYVQLKKKDSSESFCHAKFHLVDLAGSERAKRTQAQGDRFREGVNINRGLLALGNVISALGDENGRKSHIPYRDSKLTRLLQDSLGGNSQTVMIACISPADSNMEETLNTLRYADRARRIKNKPIVNRDPQAAELNKLKQQVQQLQIQLLQGKILNGEGDSAAVIMEGGQDLKTLLERNKSLEAENTKLSNELQASIDQTTQMYEKVILAEMTKEKLKQKLVELRASANMSIGVLDMTIAEGGAEHDMSKVKEQLGVMKDLQQKIADLENQQEEDEKAEALYGDDESRPTTAATSSDESEFTGPSPRPEGEASSSPDITKTHALRQAALSRELHELNHALARKQELAQTMGQSDEKMQVMRIQYETTMKQLEDQVNTLSKEKETLSHELFASKTNANSNKLSEQRRKRLQELEAQLGELKKKINSQAKLVKLKEKSDLTVGKLNNEIGSMKQARVRLMKQMKEDTGRFQQWKRTKDKEVLQLKAKDRKRQFEYTRLERQNQKTQNVLRRKMEEASAANRRLKDALEKKSNARNGKTNDTNRLEGMGKRIKSWIDHELEVRVSVNEAKRHLASLLNDRKTLSKEIGRLERSQSTPQGDSQEPSGKPLLSRLNELRSEIELRNAQISDLQQKIMDADNDEKSQTNRWHNITSMPEAKCSIDRLMEAATLSRVEMGILQSKLSDHQSSLDDAHKDKEEMETEMDQVKMAYERERTEIQRAHEDKILYLLTQLSSASDKVDESEQKMNGEESMLKQRLHFQEEQIEELKSIHEQLQETILENDELKKKLTVATYKGKKSALMPVLTSPEASPIPQMKPKKKRSTAVPKAKKIERVTLEEFFSAGESDSEFSPDSESDWMETPVKKKISRAKTCNCKIKCRGTCGCKRNGRSCSKACRCDPTTCANRKGRDSYDPDESAESTSTNITSVENTDMMNTTVVIENSASEADADTPGLRDFKLPSKPHPRKVLAPANGSVDAGKTVKPKLKRENAFGGASRKRSSDALKPKGDVAGIKGSLTNVENEGIVKRKRKLLGPSNRSFFKPLDV
ncbi:chromosome-associated kinesin KIF4 [Strongylocentrotus purpuratus]|uniref:Kinesin motor domain-containing protein n=1 Tax=Strongylocentrotus purpuratus TaxID=7668 RepID=A0A7M7NGZ6_STRPU|nr:chromosome-associated kinesin KIF4 [Strongylocentrotus purpuratus]